MQVGGQAQLALLNPAQMPQQGHAIGRKLVQVEVVAAAGAGELGIGRKAGRGRWQHVGRAVEEASQGQPLVGVLAPIAPRRAPPRAHAQKHPTTGLEQLLRDLAARLTTAHNEHRARGQVGWITIGRRGQLQHVRRQSRCKGRNLGALKKAGRQDDVVRSVFPISRAHAVARPVSQQFHGRDIHAEDHRQAVGIHIALEGRDYFVARHEAVGIIAGVLCARQPERPIGRHQGKAVPALAPGVTRPIGLFQHNVLPAMLLEPIAGCQPGLPAADDHGLYVFNRHTLSSARLIEALPDAGKEQREHGQRQRAKNKPPLDLHDASDCDQKPRRGQQGRGQGLPRTAVETDRQQSKAKAEPQRRQESQGH